MWRGWLFVHTVDSLRVGSLFLFKIGTAETVQVPLWLFMLCRVFGTVRGLPGLNVVMGVSSRTDNHYIMSYMDLHLLRTS